MISNEMWDNSQPNSINLRNTTPWVRKKCFFNNDDYSMKQQHYRRRGI